jgi:hypothetical protein
MAQESGQYRTFGAERTAITHNIHQKISKSHPPTKKTNSSQENYYLCKKYDYEQ